MHKIFLLLFLKFSLSDFILLNSEYRSKYHIKWISDQTFLPITFSISINQSEIDDSIEWDWLRLRDLKIVSKLPDLYVNYLITESFTKASLHLLNFNNLSFEHLSAYEPKLVLNQSPDDQPFFLSSNLTRNIFTLIFLNKHFIQVKKFDQKIQISCLAEFLVPSLDGKWLKFLLKQMEVLVHLKMFTKLNNLVNKDFFENKCKFYYLNLISKYFLKIFIF